MNNKYPENEPSKFDMFFSKIFNSFPGKHKVIDKEAKIVMVNQSWNNFAQENGVKNGIEWIGQDHIFLNS